MLTREEVERQVSHDDGGPYVHLHPADVLALIDERDAARALTADLREEWHETCMERNSIRAALDAMTRRAEATEAMVAQMTDREGDHWADVERMGDENEQQAATIAELRAALADCARAAMVLAVAHNSANSEKAFRELLAEIEED